VEPDSPVEGRVHPCPCSRRVVTPFGHHLTLPGRAPLGGPGRRLRSSDPRPAPPEGERQRLAAPGLPPDCRGAYRRLGHRSARARRLSSPGASLNWRGMRRAVVVKLGRRRSSTVAASAPCTAVTARLGVVALQLTGARCVAPGDCARPRGTRAGCGRTTPGAGGSAGAGPAAGAWRRALRRPAGAPPERSRRTAFSGVHLPERARHAPGAAGVGVRSRSSAGTTPGHGRITFGDNDAPLAQVAVAAAWLLVLLTDARIVHARPAAKG
jgi:hypothetical protein